MCGAFEHTLVPVTLEDASRLLLPFPAVGLSFEAVGEGARRAARGRGEEHVAVEAARARVSLAAIEFHEELVVQVLLAFHLDLSILGCNPFQIGLKQ